MLRRLLVIRLVELVPRQQQASVHLGHGRAPIEDQSNIRSGGGRQCGRGIRIFCLVPLFLFLLLTVPAKFLFTSEMRLASTVTKKEKSRTSLSSGLPSADQNWSHGTCSIESLLEALESPVITAIETDVVMGHKQDDENEISGRRSGEKIKEASTSGPLIAITAHPPDRVSDLTVEELLDLVTSPTNKRDGDSSGMRILRKHIKIDFKELGTVRTTLQYITNLGRIDLNDKMIFLNADVLPGPGMRESGPRVDGDYFLSTCLNHTTMATTNRDSKERINNRHGVTYAFSLGWTVDCRAVRGYRPDDIADMTQLIHRHDLTKHSAGVVLAVNARVLSKNCYPFDKFLDEFPSSQLLAWTATGEPPISQQRIDGIKKHFIRRGYSDRIGFDCKVAGSYLSGWAYDSVVQAACVYWNTVKGVRRCMRQSGMMTPTATPNLIQDKRFD